MEQICICLLLLLLFCVYIFTIQPLFISYLLDIEWVSSFIKYATINKGFIPLHGYFIFNISTSSIFSYPYANNAFILHNQRGFYGLRQVLHFALLKQCALIIIMWVLPNFVLIYGFIMQILYVIYIGIVGILYHDMGIITRIPSHNIYFKGAMYVLHFRFLFNDECL